MKHDYVRWYQYSTLKSLEKEGEFTPSGQSSEGERRGEHPRRTHTRCPMMEGGDRLDGACYVTEGEV